MSYSIAPSTFALVRFGVTWKLEIILRQIVLSLRSRTARTAVICWQPRQMFLLRALQPQRQQFRQPTLRIQQGEQNLWLLKIPDGPITWSNAQKPLTTSSRESQCIRQRIFKFHLIRCIATGITSLALLTTLDARTRKLFEMFNPLLPAVDLTLKKVKWIFACK